VNSLSATQRIQILEQQQYQLQQYQLQLYQVQQQEQRQQQRQQQPDHAHQNSSQISPAKEQSAIQLPSNAHLHPQNMATPAHEKQTMELPSQESSSVAQPRVDLLAIEDNELDLATPESSQLLQPDVATQKKKRRRRSKKSANPESLQAPAEENSMGLATQESFQVLQPEVATQAKKDKGKKPASPESFQVPQPQFVIPILRVQPPSPSPGPESSSSPFLTTEERRQATANHDVAYNKLQEALQHKKDLSRRFMDENQAIFQRISEIKADAKSNKKKVSPMLSNIIDMVESMNAGGYKHGAGLDLNWEASSDDESPPVNRLQRGKSRVSATAEQQANGQAAGAPQDGEAMTEDGDMGAADAESATGSGKGGRGRAGRGRGGTPQARGGRGRRGRGSGRPRGRNA
jgi:hypothetical protein